LHPGLQRTGFAGQSIPSIMGWINLVFSAGLRAGLPYSLAEDHPLEEPITQKPVFAAFG
jgi:hypothetical protein